MKQPFEPEPATREVKWQNDGSGASVPGCVAAINARRASKLVSVGGFADVACR